MQLVAFTIFIYMTLWFGVSLFLKRNDVADFAWGIGFIVAAYTSYFEYAVFNYRSLMVLILVTIWGSRLSFHIFKRNVHKTEDARYASWRIEWKKNFLLRSYLQVFILQGVLMFLIVLPITIINTSINSPLNYLDFTGLIIWLIGFYFESAGDKQLANFLHNPQNKGKILNTGLWKYTRHPNYFGEVTQWWGIWIISTSISNPLYTIIGPLTITFLILKISGIPLLEKKMSENSLFNEYRKNTSVFFPWFPEKKD